MTTSTESNSQQSHSNSSSRSTSRSADSYTDEEGSGVRVPSHQYSDEDESWEQLYDTDELISPSESASRPTSRPRNGPRYRQSESRPPPVSRPTRRHTTAEKSTSHRAPAVSRIHRHAPAPPSSVDPSEDYPAYGRGYPAVAPTQQQFGGRAPGPGYSPSVFSGPSGYAPPPFVGGGPGGALTPYGQGSPYQQFPQNNPFTPQTSPNPPPQGAGFFGPPGGHHPPHSTVGGPAGYPAHDMLPYGPPGGFQGHAAQPGYGGYGHNIGPPGMSPQHMYQYAQPPQWPQSEPSVVPDPETEKKLVTIQQAMEAQKINYEKAQKEIADRDAKEAAAIAAAEQAKKSAEEKAAWERMIAEEKASLERRNKEERDALEKKNAADKAALEKQLADEKAAWEKKVEEEKKAARAQGAENVRKQVEAENKKKEAEAAEAAARAAAAAELQKIKNDAAAEQKRLKDEAAAESKKLKEEAAAESEKLKKAAAEEAEEARKKAAAELASAIAAGKPPEPEKKKPLRFKDAVGRKFSFPFHLCATWAGMEELIKQAFMHVEVIGPHVAEGHYDLIGPNGEIILPQVWETMIEPDWSITMHMWPMPEPRPGPGPGPGPGPHHGGPFGHGPERPRSRHAGGPPHDPRDPRNRAPPPGTGGPSGPQGGRAPPQPPPGGWPPPPPPPGHHRPGGGGAGPRGSYGNGGGYGPGGPPVIVVPHRDGGSGGNKSKSKPSKTMLGWMAGKPSKPAGKGKACVPGSSTTANELRSKKS
ncbi:hypothetical protein BJ875DRAFT_445212 [Amylocarpus encephaloides]|uniref:Ubiquitin-like domain-containing protein n=1 Tax=Amylocarpus encephaloides TaxID=45428 RepID=A0A9P8C1U1_9HELO|nr:hypothetical protein BJ875DRAFT_445212 [Amylocarpus encephaloides]